MNLFYIFSLIFTQQIVATYLVYTNPSVRIHEYSYEQPHQTLDLLADHVSRQDISWQIINQADIEISRFQAMTIQMKQDIKYYSNWSIKVP